MQHDGNIMVSGVYATEIDFVIKMACELRIVKYHITSSIKSMVPLPIPRNGLLAESYLGSSDLYLGM